MDKWNFKLRGSCVALPTPFRDGHLDLFALEKLCRRQIEHGIGALVPCGTAGEQPLLTSSEHQRVMVATVKAAAGRVPVIAGVGSSNTRLSIELARSAELVGAQALLCVTPSYLKPTQPGLIAHFKAIHDAVTTPIILHDAPSRTGCALDDLTIARLADLPRIVGLKDATGDIGRAFRLRRRLGERFFLLSGDDTSQVAFRRAGGDGCISVTANVAPALCSALHKAFDRRDTAIVARYDGILAPLHEALSLEANPIPVKRALHRLGLINNDLRLPLVPLSAVADMHLAKVMQSVMPMEAMAAQRRASAGESPRPRAA
jgi:4-hydroxy-tetrahydrodipicolinate synthase